MPSYRVALAIGALAPGIAPAAVLPAAKSAALEFAVVEAGDLQVVSGQARIVVRFVADDVQIATQVAQHVASVLQQLSAVASWRLTERTGSRWEAL